MFHSSTLAKWKQLQTSTKNFEKKRKICSLLVHEVEVCERRDYHIWVSKNCVNGFGRSERERKVFLFSFYREQRSRSSEGKNAEKLQRQINGQVRENRWKFLPLILFLDFCFRFLKSVPKVFIRLLFCSASVRHKSIKWYEILNLVLLLLFFAFFARLKVMSSNKTFYQCFHFLISQWIFMKIVSYTWVFANVKSFLNAVCREWRQGEKRDWKETKG